MKNNSLITSKVRSIYEKFLYHYEKLVNEPTACKLNQKKDKVSLKDVNPSLLLEVPVFSIDSKEALTESLIDSILSKDVCVIRGFQDAF